MTQTTTPWSSVGYLTTKRTYCRKIDPDAEGPKTEEWPDVVDRVVQACNDQLGCGFTSAELRQLKKYHLELKGTVAGRFLWQLGTKTVDDLGLPSLQNCAGVVVDSPVRPFTWTMDMLMLGSGVGYNIQKEYVYKLPPVLDTYEQPFRLDTKSADFILPDTREGWVKLLEYTMRAAFYKEEKQRFSYSTILIRSRGAPIRGFGGVASGPEVLCEGIEDISWVIYNRRGKQLRPIDCLDIMNIIGRIVVAGNVRRSAQIAIGDCDDIQFLKAKNWGEGNIPNWRACSNNSVVCNNINNLPEEFWKTYEGDSEPYGLINFKLSRRVGRTGESEYPDKNVKVFNPCAEQPLEDKETCCLAEIFLPNIESQSQLVAVAKLLYRVNKHSLTLGCHHKETEKVVNSNMRMGIGITGVLQASSTQRSWLEPTYRELREFDKKYSAEKGLPESIKLTTCKPSGTLSLLPGVTPGIHPGYARYMVRRITIAADHSLVPVCRDHGYPIEFKRNLDGTTDRGSVIVSFPFEYPEGTVLAGEVTAIDQLEWVRWMQRNWSDNAVSCTVYYRKEELPEIRKYLKKHYNQEFKSLSFLLHEDHGFDQAPYEEISEEEFKALSAKVRPITEVSVADFEGIEECEGGACPVK